MQKCPSFSWPDGKQIAVTFVVNFEEGSESSKEVVHEVRESRAEKDVSNYCVESHFEYGTRVGYWRVMEVFERFNVKVTLSACGRAVERSPWLAKDAMERGHEIAAHGYLWEAHDSLTEGEEITAIERCVDAIRNVTGQPPMGWHTRSKRSPNTRRLLQERGFLYSDDAYNDDTPYFVDINGQPHLILPYAFDTNDMQFQENSRFNTAGSFAQYCIDSFDWMCAREQGIPRMMTIGLHLRIIGRAGRMVALEKILEHLTHSDRAWIVPRIKVARHWLSSSLQGVNPLQSPLKIANQTNSPSSSGVLAHFMPTYNKEFKTLLVINPNTSREATRLIEAHFQQHLPSANVIGFTATNGVSTICTEESYATAGAEVCETFKKYLKRKDCKIPDAIIVACFGDPGVYALREVVAAHGLNIPVYGLAEASMQHAASSGQGRFVIVTGGLPWGPILTRLTTNIGLKKRLGGVHTLALNGAQLKLDRQMGLNLLRNECRKAIADCNSKNTAEKNCVGVILGGALLAGMAKDIESEFDVPLIDCIAAASAVLRRFFDKPKDKVADQPKLAEDLNRD